MESEGKKAQALDFQLIFESIPGLCVILLPDLTIVAASNSYLNGTNTEREEILGRKIFDVFPDNPKDPAATGVTNLSASLQYVLKNKKPHIMPIQKYDIRNPHLTDDGFEERYWSPFNVPVLSPESEVTYIIHRVEDVTEYVKAKQREATQEQKATELQVITEKMEEELFTRVREVELANSSRKQQAEFIDTVCHEIRNPLNGILGIADTLNEEIEKIEDILKEEKELSPSSIEGLKSLKQNLISNIKSIEECGSHQLDIINQVLEISRLELNKLKINLEPFSLIHALQAVIAIIQPQIHHKNLHFKTELPTSDYIVVNDATRFKQIVLNLLSNAVKYTPSGGYIHFCIKAKPREGSDDLVDLEVCVKDSGSGFDEEEKAKLFQRFSQFNRVKSSKYDSSGLGLAICKQLIVLMGGALDLETQKWLGSTFKINFTWQTSKNTLESKSTITPLFSSLNKELPILIVEDSEINQAILRRILTKLGYTCDIAYNGIEAIEKYQSLSPKLIFMDLEMPKMGGLEAARVIRGIEQKFDLKRIPIYALSGFVREEYEEQAIKAGMDGLLTKPLGKEELYAVLDKVFPKADSTKAKVLSP